MKRIQTFAAGSIVVGIVVLALKYTAYVLTGSVALLSDAARQPKALGARPENAARGRQSGPERGVRGDEEGRDAIKCASEPRRAGRACDMMRDRESIGIQR